MAEEKKRTYQAEVLGLPPLRMVLVHAENDRRNAALKPKRGAKRPEKENEVDQDDLLKIIEHLKREP